MTTAVDIVIPTLNAGASLGSALAARPAHPDLAFPTTICDGGSRDDTVAIAQRAGAAVVTAAAGRGGQLATGAAAGRAPWILFLHADTRLQSGAGVGWRARPRTLPPIVSLHLHSDDFCMPSTTSVNGISSPR